MFSKHKLAQFGKQAARPAGLAFVTSDVLLDLQWEWVADHSSSLFARGIFILTEKKK